MLFAAVVGVAVLAAVAFMVARNDDGGPDPFAPQPADAASVAALDAVAEPAGCRPLEQPPSEGALHYEVGTQLEYQHYPPATGGHYPSVTQTGIHETPQAEGFFLHNMEHGHVVIHHNGIDEALLVALEDIVREEPDWVIIHPYPRMDHALAFTSWGRRMVCDEPSAAAAAAARLFVDVFKDDGPESIPGPRGRV